MGRKAKFYVCDSGSNSDPRDPIGFIGRVYIWEGEWIRSPQEVADRDKNPIMKLYPIDGEDFEVEGDVGCFSEITLRMQPDGRLACHFE